MQGGKKSVDKWLTAILAAGSWFGIGIVAYPYFPKGDEGFLVLLWMLSTGWIFFACFYNEVTDRH